MSAVLAAAQTPATPYIMLAALAWAMAALTAAVNRKTTRRHARVWSRPRPARLLTAGSHCELGRRRAEKREERQQCRADRARRREYAATQSRHVRTA